MYGCGVELPATGGSGAEIFTVAGLTILIQDIVSSEDDEEGFRTKVDEIRGYINEFSQGNQKLGGMLRQILENVKQDKNAYSPAAISPRSWQK